jgi:glycosyltransferase involved in cell wall biosynthesis
LPATAVRIACFATGGSGSNDEDRVRGLLEPFGPDVLPFDRGHKGRSARRLLRALARERPDLLVMEGTGLAGGIAALLGKHVLRIPFIVSSGDAVAPFVAMRHRLLLPVGLGYERLLYRSCSGFIGWTPYLVGRALTWGAPRAVTAANWPPEPVVGPDARATYRTKLGIAPDALVFGLVGALAWAPSRGYCYGLDLVRAIRRCTNERVVVVVVGDGSGRARLADEAGELLGARVILTGAVPRAEVPAMLATFDVAALPQSTDAIGSFRYTTKLSEYLAAGLPVVTGQIPAAYDLDDGWLWRLPGDGPWEDDYVDALVRLMNELEPEELRRRAARVPRALREFDRASQVAHVTAFVTDVLRRSHIGQ